MSAAATKEVCIAVDVMGGDNAPDVVIEGIKSALLSDEHLRVLAVGPQEVIDDAFAGMQRVSLRYSTEVIGMDEHPATAVRAKKDSSVVVACKAVKEGLADGFFSAGSTGACMSAATLFIGRIRGIARPALATWVPARQKPVLLLDVGANADCKPEYLHQFALMGKIYSSATLKINEPSIALLNIGEEETKGNAFAQECHAYLKEHTPGFVGNAE
ncbi:MAG: phosphate--acyl-ACP acyltransferase, partial [Eggerthellaceae bacterium]|nr:phosphate--acyl-ACP acyltransferase [Eggerthellaceae bacterium]